MSIDPGLMCAQLGGGGTRHQIEQSIKLDASSSQYFTWTPTVVGNRTTFTISMWLKRGILTSHHIFSAGSSSINYLVFTATGQLYFAFGGDRFKTTATYLDLSAHYHIVMAVDTTVPEIKVYVNGDEVTAFDVYSAPTLNAEYHINNSGQQHRIGSNNGGGEYLDGYVSDFVLVDGAALDADSFGEFDANGVWVPLDLSELEVNQGTGVNGTLITDATGDDQSGGSNDWTPVNTPIDSLDTPTDNYSVINPAEPIIGSVTNNGLTYNNPTGWGACRATVKIPDTGKWYFEAGGYSNLVGTGFATSIRDLTPPGSPFSDAGQWSIYGGGTDRYYNENDGGTATGDTATAGDTNMLAIDMDTGHWWAGEKTFGWYNSGDPAAGTGYLGAIPAGDIGDLFAYATCNGDSITFNFGGADFETAAPTEFLPLSTASLTAGSDDPVTGSFTGNAAVDGPFVWLGYTPDEAGTCTINGNAITWGTHARATAGGMKIITSSASYNSSGTNTYSIATLYPFGGSNVAPATAR